MTITSQGQITIPAKLKRSLGFTKSQKANVREEDGKLIIEPVVDLLDLAGSLSKYAKKNKSIDEIMKMEKEAVGEAIAERYKRKLKREGNKLLTIKP